MLHSVMGNEAELKKLLHDCQFQHERYKYYFANGRYTWDLENNEQNWTHIHFVSKRGSQIIGYLQISIAQPERIGQGVGLINFENQPSFTWSKDIAQFYHDVFYVHGLRKIIFSCTSGNPAQEQYEKFIARNDGRCVGYYEQHDMLPNGEYRDSFRYEIVRPDLRK